MGVDTTKPIQRLLRIFSSPYPITHLSHQLFFQPLLIWSVGLPFCKCLDLESEPCCLAFIPPLLPFLPNTHHGINRGPAASRLSILNVTMPSKPLCILCPSRLLSLPSVHLGRACPCLASELQGLFTVPHGPPQSELGIFHSMPTKPSPFPRPNLYLLTSILCSSSECLPYWDPNLLFEILSSKIQSKDHRAQLARRGQLTVSKSGKSSLIICAVHSICSSLFQAAVQPRTWVCSWENKPNCANGGTSQTHPIGHGCFQDLRIPRQRGPWHWQMAPRAEAMT